MQKDEVDKFSSKLVQLQRCITLLTSFDSFVSEHEWNSRFAISLDLYLDQVADANMRIFMGMPRATDLVPHVKNVAR